jgi:riboflavin synthase
MFTGLIEEVGTVLAANVRADLLELRIGAATVLGDIAVGDSIAVSGVCLTVTSFEGGSFSVQVVPETVRRSTLGRLRNGSRVNLERSLRVGDRLGGHFVFGHVDAVGSIASMTAGEQREFRITAPPELDPYIVEKGSIAMDGISLTVTGAGAGWFGVSVIPHTLEATTLGEKRPGDPVNLETDVFAKYVEKYARPKGGLTMETLRREGYV